MDLFLETVYARHRRLEDAQVAATLSELDLEDADLVQTLAVLDLPFVQNALMINIYKEKGGMLAWSLKLMIGSHHVSLTHIQLKKCHNR